MKPPVRLVAGGGAPPVGFDALVRAMADLADLRVDADGPVLTWRLVELVELVDDDGIPATGAATSDGVGISARLASEPGGQRAESGQGGVTDGVAGAGFPACLSSEPGGQRAESLVAGRTVVLGPASIALPPLLVNLDGDRPMLPFLRARGRRMRGLNASLTVEAGNPLMHLARVVDASAASDRDLIRALATAAVVVGDPQQARRLDIDPSLVGQPPSDERSEAARCAAAAAVARRFDPRSIAIELMNSAGIGPGSVRHALVELHRGALDRIDGRVARLVGTKGMGVWA